MCHQSRRPWWKTAQRLCTSGWLTEPCTSACRRRSVVAAILYTGSRYERNNTQILRLLSSVLIEAGVWKGLSPCFVICVNQMVDMHFKNINKNHHEIKESIIPGEHANCADCYKCCCSSWTMSTNESNVTRQCFISLR